MKKDSIESDRKLTFKGVCQEIKNAKIDGYTKIDFYGGEPLIYSFIARAIKYANKMGLACFLATNATKFSSSRYTKLFYSDIVVEEIRVTLHSHRPEIHNRISQRKNSFRETVQGIKNIVKQKKSRVSVNIVITSLNYKDLPKITNFIYTLGVKSVTYSGLVVEGRLLENTFLLVNLSDIQPYILESIKLCNRTNIDFRIIKLPICILKDTSLIPYRSVQEVEDSNNFLMLPYCKDCTYFHECIGLEKHTLLAFGLPEFYKKY